MKMKLFYSWFLYDSLAILILISLLLTILILKWKVKRNYLAIKYIAFSILFLLFYIFVRLVQIFK